MERMRGMKEMIKQGFSFRNKLIVSFMLVSLLPVVIVQLISYYVSSEAMKEKIDVLVHANLLQTSKNLDTSMRAYDDIVQQIITNEEVIQLINTINLNHEDLEFYKRKLINTLAGYSYAKNGIRSVTIFTTNGTLISYDQQTGSPYDNLWTKVEDLSALPLYNQALSQAGSVITEPMRMDNINNNEEFGFHIARKINDFNSISLEGIGVVVITVYESVLAQAINLSDSETPNPIDNRNFLVNEEGMIVSSPDKAVIGNQITDVYSGSTIINRYSTRSNGLIIYNLIDQNELFNEMFKMRRLSILTGLLAIVFSGWLIVFFSGRLSSSIRNVVRAMKVAQQGMLTVQVEHNPSRDEISHISTSFNKMMNTINELISETKEANEKKREAEIRALESQINPHFLYNTLDSINWLAIEKEEHQISHMLKGLAQILRYSIKDSNKRVTLQEEMEWMNQYINLQQFRFRSSFTVHVHCGEEALACKIPKLILQPVIENAIIHGFEGLKQGGILQIDITMPTERTIQLVVSDNGKGMDDNTMSAIAKGVSGIGFRNVRERLEIYYGHRARLDITSQVGEGTTVQIIMPIIDNREDSE